MPNKSYAKLLEGVTNSIKRGDYPKMLKMLKKMRNNYSINNTFLVYQQNPDATIVKGFCDWKKLGRGVKKHPRTIFIYTPIGVRKKEKIEGQQNLDGKEEKKRNIKESSEEIQGLSYRRVAVYDIGDTYLKKGSKRIPIIDDTINDNTSFNLYEALTKISPIPIKQVEINGIKKGYYDTKNKEIIIKSNQSQDDKTATLLHELCHYFYDDFDYSKQRSQSEVFVESVVFLVADHFNFDTSRWSFGYITDWSHNDIKDFLKITNKIKETADKFIDLIKNSNFEQQRISA